MRRPTWPLLALLSLSACGDDLPAPTATARLVPLADCGDAAEYIKRAAIDRMNTWIDEGLDRYARGEACGYGDDRSDSGGAPPSPPPSGPTTGTGTNNQVANVHEADFVQNDGQYIYLAHNGVLRIVDAWPAYETHEVSATVLEGRPTKMFVRGDTAIVYVALDGNLGGWGRYGRDCTYGYDCDFTGDGSATRMLVFDISDRSAPVLERQIDLSGSLIAARRIDSAVHTVVTEAATMFKYLQTTPELQGLCDYDTAKPSFLHVVFAARAFELLRETNKKQIEDTDLTVRLPTVVDRSGLTPADDPGTCSSLWASSIADGTAFTSVVSIDLDHPGPVKTATIVSRAGAVYASPDALYLAVGHDMSGTDRSTVHKFRISDQAAHTRYLASGWAPGRALNQFALDEHEGRLRIATTNGRAPSESAVSYLTVLEERGDDLVTLGSLGGIAPTEDIRSVRFDGARAYVVTFKKTDPLFAFDLSEPTAPRMLGELKIPGFSTYMHMMDDSHLLTIGYDADDHGDFAYFDGVMLQIFDVTDPTQPRLAHKHVIGTRGSSSEALTNHLAFTWYPERALLALPMTICEGGDDGTYGTSLTFSGLMVFDASTAAGFGEHGRVDHSLEPGVSCSNWWTAATSAVRRSLFLDQFVYSISDRELNVRDVGALGTAVATVPLAPPAP